MTEQLNDDLADSIEDFLVSLVLRHTRGEEQIHSLGWIISRRNAYERVSWPGRSLIEAAND